MATDKIKTKLIGSFHGTQVKVKVYSTNIKVLGEELFVCKTVILHKRTNGKKGSIRFGNRTQIVSLLKAYGRIADGTLMLLDRAIPERFHLDDAGEQG